MGFLAPIFMLSISYIMGLLWLKLFRDNKAGIMRTCLVGTFFVLSFFELTIIICHYLNLGFRNSVRIFCFIILLVAVFTCFWCFEDIKRHLLIKKPFNIHSVIVICVIVIAEFILLALVSPDLSHDYTQESVNTIIVTDTVLEYDYLTGAPLEGNISFKQIVDELPFLYAMLSILFSADTDILIHKFMPIWAISLCFLVYAVWAIELYEKEEQASVKKTMFVAGVCVLCMCGAFSTKSLFYYQTFEGFRGEAICYGVIVPYIVYELLFLFRNKKWQSVIYILMAFMGALLVTTPAKGLVPCCFVVLAAGIVAAGYKIRRYIVCR